MAKSPSSTSTNSNASEQPKVNANLYNMFGTPVVNQPPVNTQPVQQVNMQKQGNPGTGASNQIPNSPQKDGGFADFWANSTNKQGQANQQPNVVQPPKTTIPPPIQTQTVQPPQNTNPNANKTPPTQPDNKGQSSGRANTFNQLFGLGNK